MADQLEQEKLDESVGETTFDVGSGRVGPYFYPRGFLGKFFARFFATKAQPAVVKEFDNPEYGKPSSSKGDTIVHDAPGVRSIPGVPLAVNRSTPVSQETEINRKKRYKSYEGMDEQPEVGSAFDIYADDCTQRNTNNERWSIKSTSNELVQEVMDLFEKLRLDRLYWDITRNAVKFGDCFLEMIVDENNPNAGVQRLKILNPNFILRVEDKYGYLTNFLQEIPQKSSWENMVNNSYESQKANKYIELDKNQIVHFKLFTSDPKFYPYGKSVGSNAVQVFKSLRLMEDAMLVYRLARAPERRIFYIDVGNLPSGKAEMFIERVKEKFKKEKYFNRGGVDERYNPLSADEDFFVPVKGGNQGTKIETLPGAQNLGETADVQYFRDKLLAALKIPKDFIVEKDKSPERKANLSQLDVKFARTITRVQHAVELGLEDIARTHLRFKEFPESLIKELRVELPDPSDMFTKRKLEIDEAKIRIIQAVTSTGLFPKEHIYKEYYDMSEGEIKLIKNKLEQEAKEMAEQQGEMNAISPGAGDMNQGNQPAAVQNTQPMAGPVGEEVDLTSIKKRLILEKGANSQEVKAMNRIIKRLRKN